MKICSYDEAQEVLQNNPLEFKKKVEETLRRHVAAVNKVTYLYTIKVSQIAEFFKKIFLKVVHCII